jgi:carboxymethylenebutenolidase
MHTEWVQVEVGGRAMPSYLARGDAPNAPGVVVLQEIFGVNVVIRRITEVVASAGFTALAPNFYHRTHPDLDLAYDDEGKKVGMAAAMQTTIENLSADIQAAQRWLRSEQGAPAVGVWGFCFGGSLAYLAATFPQTQAAVSFYGGQIAKSPMPTRPPMITFTELIRAPLFLVFGGADAGIPPEEVEAIRSALTEAGKTFELHVYPDEDHGFFRPGANGDSPAIRDVRPKVEEFLHKHLG